MYHVNHYSKSFKAHNGVVKWEDMEDRGQRLVKVVVMNNGTQTRESHWVNHENPPFD